MANLSTQFSQAPRGQGDADGQIGELPEHSVQFASQMWNHILQRCETAKVVARATFEDLYGKLDIEKLNPNKATSMTAFQLLAELAVEKTKGKQWNAFEGELARLERILGESPWIPKSSASLKLLLRTWFLDYFAKPVTLSFCPQGNHFSLMLNFEPCLISMG